MEHYRRTVHSDCEKILLSFQSTDSVRFQLFTVIWKQINFSSMFHCVSERSVERVLTQLTLSIAASYLFPPYTFQIRVGGLYLLYSLYSTQLITPKEKIRLALKDWRDLMSFLQDAVSAQHYDVVYILRKLLSEKAFNFTAMPNPLSFNVKRSKQKRSQQLCETFVDRPSRPQEVISTDMLEELANVHEHYEKLKKEVLAPSVEPELSLIKQNLVPKLHNAVVTYYNWQQNHTSEQESESQSVTSDREAGEGTSSQEESSRRAQLLESIKSRSYGQAVEASKSRRHRQVEVISATTDSDPTGETSRHKFKVHSLKERTLQRVTDQEIQNKELMEVTRMWRLTSVDSEKINEKKKIRFNWKS